MTDIIDDSNEVDDVGPIPPRFREVFTGTAVADVEVGGGSPVRDLIALLDREENADEYLSQLQVLVAELKDNLRLGDGRGVMLSLLFADDQSESQISADTGADPIDVHTALMALSGLGIARSEEWRLGRYRYSIASTDGI